MPRTITATLSDYASATTIDALPVEVRERAKKVVFDEIACAYFGRRSPAGQLAARYALSQVASGEARILGSGTFSSAPFAALANGTAGHGEEVDGAHVVGGHPGASIVHAATAVAESRCATGADLVNAVVLGYEVGVRLVRACGGKFVVRDRKNLTSDFLFALGATAASARLLGLDATRHAHALALATFQTNGLYALYSESRHISKSFCNGQYAFAGISAALMSAAGLEGNEDIVGSRQGLLDAWGVDGGAAAIVEGLGREHAIMQANFKFLNAGYPIHTPVEAALSVVHGRGIALDAVAGIAIGMPENAMRVVDNRAMHTICVQDMVAASLARGGLKLADLPFPAVLDDPVFRRLRSSITVSVDPDLQRENPDGRGARVTVTTRDGRTETARIDHPKGHCLRGEVSWDDLLRKWDGSLADCDVPRAVEIARQMETLEDVRMLTGAFGGRMR